MSLWSWLKLAAVLWLLRWALRVTGWLIVAAVAVAAWPLTIVAAIGYLAAWRAAGRRPGCGTRPAGH